MRLLAAPLLLILALPARAGSPASLWRAMEDELARSMNRLALEGLPRPYYLSYAVQDVSRRELVASFGRIRHDLSLRLRNYAVDLRVGSPDFDNSHFLPAFGLSAWSPGPVAGALPVSDDYGALRHEFWIATDAAYTSALDRFSRKLAYRQAKLIRDVLPDMSPAPVSASRREIQRPAFPEEAWKRRLEKLSSIFKDYPEIQDGSIALYWTEVDGLLADSDGRRVGRPMDDYELYAVAGAQAEDGMRLSDQRRMLYGSPGDIPHFSILEAEIGELARELKALTRAESFREDYVGPVLLEGQAAGEFFAQLFAAGISFPREIWTEADDAGPEFRPGPLTGRLGTRVLSRLFDAEDDPGLTAFEGVPLIGGYEFDDEGVPAKRVLVAEAGILRGIPASRSPSKKTQESNGHGRGPLWQPPRARISNLVLTARETVSASELKRRLLLRAKDFGLGHAYVARRLRTADARRPDSALSAPILLYRVDAETGEETLVRDAEFANVTLRALRDIVSAGGRRHVYNHYQLGPGGQGQTPASIVHPSVLVAEMELKRTHAKPDKLPRLKHPYFE